MASGRSACTAVPAALRVSAIWGCLCLSLRRPRGSVGRRAPELATLVVGRAPLRSSCSRAPRSPWGRGLFERRPSRLDPPPARRDPIIGEPSTGGAESPGKGCHPRTTNLTLGLLQNASPLCDRFRPGEGDRNVRRSSPMRPLMIATARYGPTVIGLALAPLGVGPVPARPTSDCDS